jgi:putative membrane protein insertion efficiency factor
MGSVRSIASAPIRFYRRFLSPLKPPMCRFKPTCSQYAIEALEVHGVVRGTLLAVWRILRCQPFARGGFDPVPPRNHHHGHIHE